MEDQKETEASSKPIKDLKNVINFEVHSNENELSNNHPIDPLKPQDSSSNIQENCDINPKILENESQKLNKK